MNNDDRKNLGVILERMDADKKETKRYREGLDEKVKSIHICLKGNDEDHEDTGLIGSVNENTRFRKSSKKTLTAMGIPLVGLVVKFLWESLTKLFKGG